jgi:antitoxin component of MazEF toxin-antitoxin module
MQMVKINQYKLRPSGARGLLVSLPRSWYEEVGLSKGDTVDVYRDNEGRLILEKAKPRPAQ